MTLDQYLSNISTVYKDGIAPELYEGEIPNLKEETINQIAHKTMLHFILEKDPEGNVCMANNKEVRPEFRQTFSPIDILDYMYAVLHSSNFRSAENKILKTSFPYPKNTETFWELAEIGSKIKEIHSLKKRKENNSFIEFCNRGSGIISNPRFENYARNEKNYGRVYINEIEYFENVPETVWTYTIENHQPAQKWLVDRIGQKMNPDDINYYKKLLFALSETERLVLKIDEITLL